MKRTGFLFVLCISTCVLFLSSLCSPYQTVSLDAALSMGLANVSFTSTGTYSGPSITADIENLSGEMLNIRMKPGRRLHSINKQEQDILLVEEKEIKLNPGDHIQTLLMGYCAQSANNAPSAGAAFDTGKQDTGQVAVLAKYLAENKYPQRATQHALWSFTNDHSVAGIHHAKRDSIQKLLEFVCDLKGVPVPSLTQEYMTCGNGGVFNDRVTQIQVDFACKGHGTKIVFNLYDRKGSIVKRVILPVTEYCARESHAIRMPVDDVGRGKYYLKAWSGSENLGTYPVTI